jgi:hypothetical protein
MIFEVASLKSLLWSRFFEVASLKSLLWSRFFEVASLKSLLWRKHSKVMKAVKKFLFSFSQMTTGQKSSTNASPKNSW